MKACTAAARAGSSPQISSARRCSSVGKPSPAPCATATIARATSPGFSGWRSPAAQARTERSAIPIFRATAVGPTRASAGLILLSQSAQAALYRPEIFRVPEPKKRGEDRRPKRQPPSGRATVRRPGRAALENAAGKRAAAQPSGANISGTGDGHSGSEISRKVTSCQRLPSYPADPMASVRHSRQIANRVTAKSQGRVERGYDYCARRLQIMAFRPIAVATRKKFQGRRREKPLICRACAGLVQLAGALRVDRAKGAASEFAHPISPQLCAKLRRSSLRMAQQHAQNGLLAIKEIPVRPGERVALG